MRRVGREQRLGRDRFGQEAERRKRARFYVRREVRVGAHRAGNLPNANLDLGSLKTRATALHLGEVARQREPEGDGLRVHPVAPPNHGRLAMLIGPPRKRCD